MSDGQIVAFPGAQDQEIDRAVEALLFAAGDPVSAREIAAALDGPSKEEVQAALHRLATRYVGRGIHVETIAGKWQFRTDARFGEPVRRLRGASPQRMSRAALEALAVVAYRQPVIRSELDEVRGVASGGVLKTLLDKGYIRVLGRRAVPGRPLEYGTTDAFLEMFALDGLSALPTLQDRHELEDEPEEGAGLQVELDPRRSSTHQLPGLPPQLSDEE